MKFVLIILVLVVFYLFYPVYDLYRQPDPFVKKYEKVSESLWTHGNCLDKARAMKLRDFRCRKRTPWSSLFKTGRKYGQESEAANSY